MSSSSESIENPRPSKSKLYEDDEAILTMLPAHADLKRTYVNLNRGDYIRVELTELIPPRKEGGYPKRSYKVLVDEDRKVEWPDDEDDEYFE